MPVVMEPEERQDTRAEKVLVVVGIVVLAFNLRPAAVSVGPVLDEITTGLGISSTTAGVLTTLPVLSFAGFGALAPWLARVLGLHRITLVALVSVVVGLGLRSQTANVPAFLLLSLLALAGMATANVLLPSLVKLHFPDRVGLMTSIYTTSLAVGLTLSSVLTVPLSEQFGRAPPAASPSARSPAPGSGGAWRCSSGSSRCRPTRCSAGSRRSTVTPASPPAQPVCCSV
jgi:CP family cyanate transporter-like MFS transporter